MEPRVLDAMLNLHRLMFELVYHNPVAKGEEGKAGEMITMLYNYMLENPEKLPAEYSMIAMEEGIERAAADFISGMTDRYAISIYKEFFIPESWGVK